MVRNALSPGKEWTGVTYGCARVKENHQGLSFRAVEACRGEMKQTAVYLGVALTQTWMGQGACNLLIDFSIG